MILMLLNQINRLFSSPMRYNAWWKGSHWLPWWTCTGQPARPACLPPPRMSCTCWCSSEPGEAERRNDEVRKSFSAAVVQMSWTFVQMLWTAAIILWNLRSYTSQVFNECYVQYSIGRGSLKRKKTKKRNLVVSGERDPEDFEVSPNVRCIANFDPIPYWPLPHTLCRRWCALLHGHPCRPSAGETGSAGIRRRREGHQSRLKVKDQVMTTKY